MTQTTQEVSKLNSINTSIIVLLYNIIIHVVVQDMTVMTGSNPIIFFKGRSYVSMMMER